MPISTIETLLRAGGMLEVLGGLRAKKYELFLDDTALGLLRLEGVPARRGWFEGKELRLDLHLMNGVGGSTAVLAIGAGQNLGQLMAQPDLGIKITTASGLCFICAAAPGGRETLVTLEPDAVRLLRISGGGCVGMRTVLVAPSQLGPTDWQTVLVLILFHLVNTENSSG